MRPRDTDIRGWYLEMCKSGDDWISTIQTSMEEQLHFGPQEKIEQHGFYHFYKTIKQYTT